MRINKLKSLIVEKGFTQKTFAEKIGMNASVLSKILNGKREMNVSEATSMMEALELSPEEAGIIFLTK